MKLDQTYWENRYSKGETGWDIGHSSPAILSYFVDNNINKTAKILIPGAGNAYEAEALHTLGYTVDVVDLADHPLQNLRKRVPSFPTNQCIQGDFFALDKTYDYIVEQTFFCALDPTLRKAYATKMQSLLKPAGKLIGLLFNKPLLGGPPFGGNEKEYRDLFSQHFSILEMNLCQNSIKPRQGNELFIELQAL